MVTLVGQWWSVVAKLIMALYLIRRGNEMVATEGISCVYKFSRFFKVLSNKSLKALVVKNSVLHDFGFG